MQGNLLQKQVNECTDVDPTVEGIGLLWGVSCVGDEVPSGHIRKGGSIVTSRVEILETVKDVIEINLMLGS